MAANESLMRRQFRQLDARNSQETTVALSRLRKSRPREEYPAIIRAFRAAALKTARRFFALGPRSTSELVWSHVPLDPVSLGDELAWAQHWLVRNSYGINAFRQVVSKLQDLLLASNISEAIDTLDGYVRSVGWSLWAVELRAALLQVGWGTNAQRAWLAELQSRTVNSIPGLLFEVFSDRNDDTYSYDAISTKCLNSFPRFESIAPWLVDYLKFRSLLRIDDATKALPSVLSRDITSSLIDYYEDIVDILTTVVSDETLKDWRPAALNLISALISNGFTDHRLHKMRVALAVTPHDLEIQSEPDERLGLVYLRDATIPASPLLVEVAADLATCRDEGASAYEVVGKLLKWGLNLKGLDIGGAVAAAAIRATWPIEKDKLVPISVALSSEPLCIDDAVAFPDAATARLLRTYLLQTWRISVGDEILSERGAWSWRLALPEPGPIHLWLAREAISCGNFSYLEDILQFLSERGPYWARQCIKLRVLALSQQHRIAEAIALLDEWLRRDPRYAIEFPCDAFFEGRKWKSLKDIDPVAVGLVAHYTFELNGTPYVSYVCKMACRTFLQSGQRENVSEVFDHASDLRKAQLVAFLRDVWIETNLAMCHQFECTAQVRVERMAVLQLLLSWESDRSAEYAEAIKDLTLDQTLERGLERIDQTRVFVNESAISRWAEKELIQDYDRWRKLSESSTGGRAVDDLLRQYALDPNNIEVLREFADGKQPTAADVLVIDIVDRLYKRFLLDPIDGLDAYLSVRIRHGSFRGTVLGPLEEQGLLYSTTGFSEEAFAARWDHALNLPPAERAELLAIMQEFSKDMRAQIDEFLAHRVQVAKADKPRGAFHSVISPLFAKVFAVGLAESPPSFHAFLCNGYFIFWKLIEVGLNELRQVVEVELAGSLRERIDTLIQELRAKGVRYLPLVTTLTTVSTTTKSQCDNVAEWFRLPNAVSGERYQLPDAIEIAFVATKNVHRSFPATIQVLCLPPCPLPLTTSALAVLMDCLFVMFENAWKHSGLGIHLTNVEVLAQFDSNANILTFESRSSLSEVRLAELLDGELTRLRGKYLGELPLDLISCEGGSGFPKLARLARAVSREACSDPFDFGVDAEQWFTRISLPLYLRDGAFEAYE